MKIAFIGTGNVAVTLAEPWARSGHDIVLGSRDPAAKTDLPYPVLSHTEAVTGADVVVNATPGVASVAAFEAIGADALAGTVLLDAGNALAGQGQLAYPNSSLGEKLHEALPGVRVVKTANTAYIAVVANPAALTDQGSLFLSGDDADAKAVVRTLLADLGWTGDSVVDLGGIATARGVEHYHLLMLALIGAARNPMVNIAAVS